MKISKRLKNIAEFVLPQQPIADIGSDHAYLPIYLIQQELVPAAIVGEVAEGPLNNAQEKINQTSLNDKISVRLGDGLSVLKQTDMLGTIFICGMGGILIKEILEEGLQVDNLPQEARLVLQPNNNEDILRQFLMNNHYEIIAEDIMEENNKIYEIIVAEYSINKVDYTAEELLFGPKLLMEKPKTFNKKWETILHRNLKILKNINNSNNLEDIQKIKESIKLIEQVIK